VVNTNAKKKKRSYESGCPTSHSRPTPNGAALTPTLYRFTCEQISLEKHIEEIRIGIKVGRFVNEAAVSQGIVLSILHALSWPTYDTQVGREMHDVRPFLVLSPRAFNDKTMLPKQVSDRLNQNIQLA